MDSDADPGVILALAAALAPLDLDARCPKKTLLRLAIERSGYAKRFSFPHIEALAALDPRGAAHAWESANAPPLAHWLHSRLSGYREESNVESALVCKIIALTPKISLAGDPDHARGLPFALLDKSGPDEIGLGPILAWARARGASLPALEISERGGPPQRAILLARHPEAFDLFLSSGLDPRALVDDEPLWSRWRSMASRRSDKALFQAIDSWASVHEAGSEASRKDALYFKALAGYRGSDILRSRPNWPDLLDERGRTALMALALSGSSIKTCFGVKKALPSAARLDLDGRSLWHYVLAHGKDAPAGSAAYLIANTPLSTDSNGRGLLPSLFLLRGLDGNAISDHEWLFDSVEARKATEFAPSAHAWLACPDPGEARVFAAWLANERYVGTPENHRGTRLLAELALALDPLSFCSIDPDIAGALAVNLAMSRTPFLAPQREAVLAALLSQGAFIELSPERESLLAKHSSPSMLGMIKAAFGAARDALELDASTPKPPKAPAPPGSALRM